MKIDLYDHQLKIIEENKKKVGLFLSTGSAKTLTALLLAEGRILVVTPKINKEEENFKREAKKWGIDKPIRSMSKENFRKYADTLPRYDTIIIDEAHTVAGITTNMQWARGRQIPKASQLYNKTISYIERTKPDRIYLLTATPIRTPMVVYGLARILGHKWNFYEFRDTFYFPIKHGYREFWIPKSDPATKERLGKAVRNIGYTGRLTDYFDVPDQTYKTIKVELTDEQKDRLLTIITEFPDPLVQIGKKHQIENGVLKGDEFSPDEEFKDNKIEKIKELAMEFPKIIIYAKYTQQINRIERELKKEKYNVCNITGKSKDRAEILKKAEASDKCILIIQAQISAGYELPSFPVMIFASMSYSVVDREQAEGRILRANKLKKNLYITLVAKGGVDEAVNKSINNKKDFNEKIYAEKRSTISNKV